VKVVFGILLILSGIILGLYVGIWLMVVGGIIQVVEAFQVDPVNSVGIAWGVVRVFFASIAGWFASVVLIIPGVGLVSNR